jgi:hypothetical protein
MKNNIHKDSIIIIAHDHMVDKKSLMDMKKGRVTAKILNLITDVLLYPKTLSEYNESIFEYKGWGTSAIIEIEKFLKLSEKYPKLIKIIKNSDDILKAKN